MDTPLVLDALGTRWWITASQPLPEEQVRSTIFSFQKKYSRFDPQSDLGKLNDTKQFDNPSEEFLALVRYGVTLFQQTNGLFNMSVGARLEQDGYGKSSDPVARISTDLSHDIEIQPNKVTVRPHVRLDFGGFGKGWLIDVVGNLLRANGINQFIINGGGDILVGETPELLFIEHPLREDEHIGHVTIQNEALASSSKQKRVWKAADESVKTHIIHTATQPSDSPLSVHVRAKTALAADTFGTVLLLASQEQRQHFAESQVLQYMEISHDLHFRQTPGFSFHANS